MSAIVGCDVSKEWIDVQIVGPSGDQRRRVLNAVRELDRFAKDLAPASVVGMEATGRLHELLAERLFKCGHTVFVINPRWIRHYGKGLGIRGKTDRSDAALIARFVGAEQCKLHPYTPASPAHRELRQLLRQRSKLVQLRMAAQSSLGRRARTVIDAFNGLIKELERRIAEIIKSQPGWHDLARRIRAQPGIGPIVAAHLVEVLTRVPFRKVDAFIAHTGLDPRSNDSGQKRGRRFLSHHGDAALRSMLFMAAMSATQRTGPWRTAYEDKVRSGLPSTAALVVIARKIARIAYSLFRSGGTYDPKHFTSAQEACIAT